MAVAQTNAPATNTPTLLEQAKTTLIGTNAQQTLNSVMIEILSGTKDAAKEIYGASKEAIHKSIDFVGEQAPDVIRQFLTWRFTYAAIWATIWVFVSGIIFFFAYKLRRYQDKASTHASGDNPSEHNVVVFFKWVFILIACAPLLFGVGTNAFEMAKIKVAPKVYIIEYVVSLIHDTTGK